MLTSTTLSLDYHCNKFEWLQKSILTDQQNFCVCCKQRRGSRSNKARFHLQIGTTKTHSLERYLRLVSQKYFFEIYFYQNIYFQHYSLWKCDSVFANILHLIWWKLISSKLVGTSLCRIQSVYRCKVTPANTVHCHQQMLSNFKEKNSTSLGIIVDSLLANNKLSMNFQWPEGGF